MLRKSLLCAIFLGFCFSSSLTLAGEDLDDVYKSFSSSCKLDSELNRIVNEAWNLRTRGKETEALVKLESASLLPVTSNCDLFAVELTRARVFSKSNRYIAVVDTLKDAQKKGIVPEQIQDAVTLQVAKHKVIIEITAAQKGNKVKRAYQLTKDERLALDWESFLNGSFAFTENTKKGFFGALSNLTKLINIGNPVTHAENLLNNKQWEDLAKFVIEKRDKGLDVDYFYLASAAKGMGLKQQAIGYANKAVQVHKVDSTKHCTQHDVKAGKTLYSYCANHNMPSDAHKLIASFDREKALRKQKLAKQAAEKQAAAQRQARKAEEKAAKQAKFSELEQKYPSEWVSAIADGKVVKGMTKDAVLESRGSPDKKETLGSDEMWSYGTQSIVFSGAEVSFISR